MLPPRISARSLSKRFSLGHERAGSLFRRLTGRRSAREHWALRDVSFDIGPGESVGIVGPNGAGKSTLLLVLAGIISPTSGSISVRGPIMPFFNMSSGLHGRLTVTDNIRLCGALFGIPEVEIESALEEILAETGLETYHDAMVQELSSGLAARIPFVTALRAQLDTILIDEMFSVGDFAFRKKCMDRMRRMQTEGKTLLLASHDEHLLAGFCAKTIYLDAGRLVCFGPTAEALAAYRQAREQATAPSGSGEAAFLSLVSRHSLLTDAVGATAWARIRPAPDLDDGALLLAHDPWWLNRLKANDLTPQEEVNWSLPQSKLLLPSSWRIAGGTCSAARDALEHGVGVHLGGGCHHAGPNHGEGFCPVNDIVVVIRMLRKEGRIRRAAVIDLDAHQGNGTALCFMGDTETFTFSMHCAEGYPQLRCRGTLDIDLPPGTGDEDYLRALYSALPAALRAARPDLAVYVAGADVLAQDQLGRLALSLEGLAARDRFVISELKKAGIPAVVTLGGGYSDAPERLVQARMGTLEAAHTESGLTELPIYA